MTGDIFSPEIIRIGLMALMGVVLVALVLSRRQIGALREALGHLREEVAALRPQANSAQEM